MKNYITITALAFASSFVQGITVEIEQFVDGQEPPTGYYDVTDGIDANEITDVSNEPYVDYIVSRNSTYPGVRAQKLNGIYIESIDLDSLPLPYGANNLVAPDTHHVVFNWTDGTGQESGSDYFGVSWSTFSKTATAKLSTKINLATDQEITIFHWFNDGWDYIGNEHSILPNGHNLTVTHFDSQGTEIDSVSIDLIGGGATAFFGDNRNYYSAIVKVTRENEGDYIIIENEAGNIGYKGTAVALITDYGVFNEFSVINGWADTGDFMGDVYVTYYPWVYIADLSKYAFATDSGWFYLP